MQEELAQGSKIVTYSNNSVGIIKLKHNSKSQQINWLYFSAINLLTQLHTKAFCFTVKSSSL
jgi:hypothetical protein